MSASQVTAAIPTSDDRARLARGRARSDSSGRSRPPPDAGRTSCSRARHASSRCSCSRCWPGSSSRSPIAAVPALQKFGFGFFFTERLEPRHQPVRRAGADLRHAGDVGDRAADRRAGELRHRAVPHRDVPGGPQAPARYGGRAARRHPIDHLRHVGPVRLRAVLRRSRPARADATSSARLAARPAVPGRAQRHRRALGRASSCRSWSFRSSRRSCATCSRSFRRC